MLFPAAAFAVHQLRYELAYGSHSGAALSAQGHGYVDSLAPWVAVLVALAFGTYLTRLARAAAAGAQSPPRRAFGGLWAVASVSLLATYSLQEWLEGLFAAGHPGGIAGVFGHGGWWAIVLSLGFGLVVAALLRLASAVLEIVLRAARARIALPGAVARPASVALPRWAPLAGAFAGRAPPGTCFAV
jgi:hypothetical protein